MQLITSENNTALKSAMRLHENRGRRQQGRIIIFGSEEIRRAWRCNVRFEELFFCEEVSSESVRKLVHEIAADSVTRVYKLHEKLYRKVAYGDRSDGLVATSQRPDTDVLNFQPGPEALILIMESIEKPGNIGAIYRSADAAGVDAVCLAEPISDPFHPNAIRSSLGSVFSIPTFCGSNETIQSFLTGNQFAVIPTRVEASQSYFEVNFQNRCAIVVGNETRGLSEDWSFDGVTAVTIPMAGKSDSLNVAMTATIMMFEARRQRLTKNTEQS